MPNKGNILKIILTLIAFLLVHASQAQVLKFMGRYDVSRVDSINDSTFRLSGEFVDLTGSYTAMDADTNDKVIIRGYNSDGKIVYDRFKITGIDARNTSILEVFVQTDFPAGIQNMTGWPGTGSFPIASPTADTSLLTYRPSMYMNGIDPDYDAALDNLNIQYSSGSIADGYWDATGQDIENMNAGYVGIGKKPTTMLDVDGVITATGGNSSQWNDAYGWGDHSLAGYLTGSHQHNWAALIDPPATYTPTTHTHDYISAETDPVWLSEKSSYSLTSHNHTGVYQPAGSYLTSESDPVWLSEKSGYSTTSHNHSLSGLSEKSYNSLSDKPDLSSLHSHGNITALNNVSGVNTGDQDLSGYSLTSHNHNASYEPIISKSTGYAKWNGSAWTFLNETYSLSSHNHSGVYQPAGSYLTSESDPVWSSEKASYSLTSHNHSGVYDPSGTASGLMSTHNSTYNHGNIATVYGWGNHAGLYPLIGDSNKTSAGNYITRKYLSDNYALTSHNHTGVYQPVGSYLTSESDPVWSSEKSGYSTTSHNHSLANLTEKSYNSLTDKPSTFPPSSHTHDDRYYTETEIGNFFSGTTAITGYNKSTWDALVSFPGFGTSGTTAAYGNHNHSGVYQPVGSYLTSESDPVWSSEKGSYSLTSHNHSGVYEPTMGTKSTGYSYWNGSAWQWKNETYSQTGHTHNYVSSVGGTSPLQSSGGYTPTISFIGDSLTLWYQKMNKGVSAYNWGNHASAGYVTGTPWRSEGYITDGNTGWDNSYGFITSPVGAVMLADSNKTSAGNYITRKFVTDNFSATGHNHSGVYDPAGTASGLMSTHNSTYDHTHIANGQTAYGWGNHASAGYVTGTPWTAMGYITDGNTGWDNSYGFITSQPWSSNGSKIYYNSGYIGIGNSNPAAPFEVNQNFNGTAVSVLNFAVGAVGVSTYGYYSGLQATSDNGPALYSYTNTGQALETHGEIRLYGLPATSSFDSMAVKKASDNSKVYWASASGLTYSSGTSTYFPVFTGTNSLGNSYLTGNLGANILSSAYLTNRFGYNSGGSPVLKMYNGSTTEVFKVESTGDVTVGGNLYLSPETASGEADSALTKESPTSTKMVYRKLPATGSGYFNYDAIGKLITPKISDDTIKGNISTDFIRLNNSTYSQIKNDYFDEIDGQLSDMHTLISSPAGSGVLGLINWASPSTDTGEVHLILNDNKQLYIDIKHNGYNTGRFFFDENGFYPENEYTGNITAELGKSTKRWETIYSKKENVSIDLTIGSTTTNTIITDEDITAPKFKITTEGGYAIKMTAGENLEQGDIVTADTAYDDRVMKTWSDTCFLVGVVYANADSANSVWVVTNGRALVNTNSDDDNKQPKRGMIIKSGRYNVTFENGKGSAYAYNEGNGYWYNTIGTVIKEGEVGEQVYIIVSIQNTNFTY